MSGVALLLRQQGWIVSGSDEGFYPPVSEILPKAGIVIRTPHAAENIPSDAALIVIGKHAKLTSENPEVAAAEALAARKASYPEVLHEIMAARDSVVVAGSYGKSSTSAIVAWALEFAGLKPGYFIGAVPRNLPAHAALGSGPFVAEGDEYPSSNTDPQAKFLHYPARSVLLTSAVHDHVNIYPTQKDYLVPFRALLRRMPRDGLAVLCADEPHARSLLPEVSCPSVTYGLDAPDADYRASDIAYEEVTRFTLSHRGRTIGRFETSQLGRHTIENMTGAAALLLERYALDVGCLAKAFSTFGGVRRRLDKITTRSAIPVYEGFGSSRDKAKAAIDAIRLHFPNRRLVAVFEPHTFSWRNRETIGWYDDAFAGAATVFVYPPPQHGAATHDQLSQSEIMARIRDVGRVEARPLSSSRDANVTTVRGFLKPGDVVLILTSGDMGGMIQPLSQALDAEQA